MQEKDYWNIITHNAKRVTPPSEFRRCCYNDLFRDIGRIYIFHCNVSRNRNGMSCVLVYFYP